MGQIRDVPAVRFFASAMYRDEEIFTRLEPVLVDVLGPAAVRSEPRLFTHSDYYRAEMGERILRRFLLFDPLRGRELLPDMKLETNGIEGAFSEDGRRTVNVDPGYIALEQVVLATTKGYTHRLYLGKGIFGDLTLIYQDGTYQALPWTYPDYGSAPIISLFNEWREAYRRDLRCRRV